MENIDIEREIASDREMLQMLARLHESQMALEGNAVNTSKLLQLTLSIASENLEIMKLQFEQIRDLAAKIDQKAKTFL